MQNRRTFLESLSLGSAGSLLSGAALWPQLSAAPSAPSGASFETLTKDLLVDWCDGMLAHQIDDPNDPIRHGALNCPACDFIHGRCWEAVYPLLHRASTTGDQKFLDAGIRLFDWSKNVSGPDGRWTNDLKPGSWHGTTIFGAIALAEAIDYHGDLLDAKQLTAWKARLNHAASDYLWKKFKTLNFTNVNYGFTAVHGFHLIGRVLENEKFVNRSHELAKDIGRHFTEPNSLLFGEGKPYDNRSDRGLLPVDLGYNVEESLNGVVLYALHEQNEELLKILQRSMEGHLEFMLDDGTWDNSWGTRQFKWTCWGSRTSDGCQPAFAMMADRNPAFGTAAYKNAELLNRCTADGLLHGGPHYVSHGIKPCIHHTFAHAKVLAFIQDHKKELPKVDKASPLPRSKAKGIKSFPEIAVWLAATGDWRATVSAYDSIYRTKSEPDHIQQATGGSLAVLFHQKVGMIFGASMAKYLQVEPLNQQELPDEDFAFTPRVETIDGDRWFTNLYDLKAEVTHGSDDDRLDFHIRTSLQDLERQSPADQKLACDLNYRLEEDQVVITARQSSAHPSKGPIHLVLPVVSPRAEQVRRRSDRHIEIIKPGGTVKITANAPLLIKPSKNGRVFNMVPGTEAVPLFLQIPPGQESSVECTISI